MNAVLRGCPEGYAGRGREQVEVARRIVAASHESVSGSGPSTWKHEGAYGDCVS